MEVFGLYCIGILKFCIGTGSTVGKAEV